MLEDLVADPMLAILKARFAADFMNFHLMAHLANLKFLEFLKFHWMLPNKLFVALLPLLNLMSQTKHHFHRLQALLSSHDFYPKTRH